MANIISIATAVPPHHHRQEDILRFMQQAYNLGAGDSRKLAFLYNHSGIASRYSVLNDFSQPPHQWQFINMESNELTPLERRMGLYKTHALPLSLQAAQRCLARLAAPVAVTHLITVSCTGMSAPGLDLELVAALGLSPHVFRTSVNFMGCYAGVHALKLGQLICNGDAGARVLIVATELCTLHFQQEYSADNAASSLLFSDGSAAVLMSSDASLPPMATIRHFHSAIATKGQQDMAWEISSKGFLMRLSGYVPYLIEEDIAGLVQQALQQAGLAKDDIGHWCLHPGGRKIIDVIQKQLGLADEATVPAREVLRSYGNMSSATIFFVLDEICRDAQKAGPQRSPHAFGVAFGPGLTMETFTATIA